MLHRFIAQYIFLCSHLRRSLLFCRQLPFLLTREVAFYHLPKIIVVKISIITLSMAYFNYLPWVVIRNGLHKKGLKVFQTNLFTVQRKQEKLQSWLYWFIIIQLHNLLLKNSMIVRSKLQISLAKSSRNMETILV